MSSLVTACSARLLASFLAAALLCGATPLLAQAPAAPAAEPPRWEPLEREIEQAAEGGLNVCEAVAFPLVIIPGVGDVVSVVADWLCLVPAALAVEHVAAHHGGRGDVFWQAFGAVLAKKLVEDAVYTPVLVAAGVLVAVYGTSVGAAIFAADRPDTVPVAVAGGLVIVTLGIMAARGLKEVAGELAFDVVFENTTSELATPELRASGRARTIIQTNPQGIARTYAVVAAAAGARAPRAFVHYIPVVGPLFRAQDNAEYVKERMRRVGRDVLAEEKLDLAAMDALETGLAWTKGSMQSLSHALLLTGGVLVVVSAVQLANPSIEHGDVDALGIAGIATAGGGLALVLLSKVPDVLRPVVVPLAYSAASGQPIDPLHTDVE